MDSNIEIQNAIAVGGTQAVRQVVEVQGVVPIERHPDPQGAVLVKLPVPSDMVEGKPVGQGMLTTSLGRRVLMAVGDDAEHVFFVYPDGKVLGGHDMPPKGELDYVLRYTA
jgi:hypothetical protein